jgi:hypothetical protein
MVLRIKTEEAIKNAKYSFGRHNKQKTNQKSQVLLWI